MTGTISKGLFQFFAVITMLVVCAPVSRAGILDTHPDAYNGWTGSVPFANLDGLSGTIDFTVFTAADFNANFGSMGYAPGDALVYTYQVNVNPGSLFVSSFTVGIDNAANTIGTFGPLNTGDVDASSSSFDLSDNAEWFFTPGEIPDGVSSFGLAFSSPNIPMIGGSVVVDGGTFALGSPVPTSSPFAVPEPGTCLLFAVCFAAALRSRTLGR
jgi:hypothetical protein